MIRARLKIRLAAWVVRRLTDYSLRAYNVVGVEPIGPVVLNPRKLIASHRVHDECALQRKLQGETTGYNGEPYPFVAVARGEFWIVDGHHRVEAARRRGELIACMLIPEKEKSE